MDAPVPGNFNIDRDIPSPEEANGLLVRPMLEDESTGVAHTGVADRRRKENQGKLVVHAGRAAWNGIRRGRPARGG